MITIRIGRRPFPIPFVPIRGVYGIAFRHLTFARNRANPFPFHTSRQPVDVTGNPLACSMCGASCCSCVSSEDEYIDLEPLSDVGYLPCGHPRWMECDCAETLYDGCCEACGQRDDVCSCRVQLVINRVQGPTCDLLVRRGVCICDQVCDLPF